jgi:hypothetical protein
MAAIRHGHLITAYKDLAALEELVDELGADAVIYVHLDRRSQFPATELQDLRSRPEVRYLSRRYRVRWGSRAHQMAMIDLARKAVDDGLADRLHLISGRDRPVWSQERMTAFFDADPQAEYLLHFPLPTAYSKDGVPDMGDAERIERSGKLFARKLDHPVSTTLMEHLADRRKGPDPMN